MSHPLRILLIEDNPDDATLVVREIEKSGNRVECTRVETADAMCRELESHHWDAVISDYSLPHFSATAALNELKRNQSDLPFIIVSGTIGEDVAVAALKAGAHDFIPKHNLRRLVPALEREIREAGNRAALRAAEHEYRLNLEMVAQVFNVAPVAMALFDAEGRVRRWNRAAESVFGWTAEEVFGRQVPFVPADRQQEHREHLRQLLSGTSITATEVVRQRKDGALIRVTFSAAPVADNTGTIVSLLNIMADVTEQRLLEDQFQQAQKMEAVGRLAGGIAHDFNNMLTIIEGYANLVMADLSIDSPVRGDVSEIIRAADHAAAFTRQLLAFSRKQVVRSTVVEMNQLLADMKKLLARVIDDTIRLHLQPSDDAHYVRADKGQLEQVIMNLVVNARDAISGAGDIMLRTRCVTLDERQADKQPGARPGDYCIVSVQDNGEGMTPEVADRIFDPFFTTKAPGKGTGLGLSTVYGIVKKNGGFIRVESNQGEGTTVSVYLPEVSADEAVQEAPPASVNIPMAKRGRHVLIVEDEAAVRQVIVRILDRAGYQLTEAAHPDEALAALHNGHHIDVLLTDIMLPGMNGQELAKKAQALRPFLQILFMSGYAEDQISIDPSLPYIEKPFTPTQLLDKLADMIRAHAPEG